MDWTGRGAVAVLDSSVRWRTGHVRLLSVHQSAVITDFTDLTRLLLSWKSPAI